VANGPSRLTVTEAGRAAIGQPTSPSQPPKRKATAEPAAKALAPPKGKIAALVDLLRRPEGATINVMMAATGWQAHSVRGAISGSIKKALGLEVASEKTEAGRVYRITSEAQA
jgi:predicted nucleic acid-binding Zn ribbon protein